MTKLKYALLASLSLLSCGKHDVTSETKDQVIMNEDGSNIFVFKNEDDSKIYIAKCNLSDMAKIEQLYQGYEQMDPRARYGTWILSQKNQCHIPLVNSKGVSQEIYLNSIYTLLKIGVEGEEQIRKDAQNKIASLRNQQSTLKTEEDNLKNTIRLNGEKILILRQNIDSKNAEKTTLVTSNEFLNKKITDNPNMDAAQLTIIKNQINTNLTKISSLDTQMTEMLMEIEKLTRSNERDIATRLVEIAKQISVLQTAIVQADDLIEDEINKLKQKREKLETDLEQGKFIFPEASPFTLKQEFLKIFSTMVNDFCSLTNSQVEIKKNILMNDKKVSASSRIHIRDRDVGISTLQIAEDSVIDSNRFSVSIFIAHSSVGDLIIDLISPQGTSVRLHDAVGGAFADINLIKTFNELSAFNNQNMRGEWKLKVYDKNGGGIGNIESFSINYLPFPKEKFDSRVQNLDVTDLGITDKINVGNSLETFVGRTFEVHFYQNKKFDATLTSPTGRVYKINGTPNKTIYPIEAAYGDTLNGEWTLQYNKHRTDANYRFAGWSMSNIVNSLSKPSTYTLSSLLNINNSRVLITDNFELLLDINHPAPQELKGILTSPTGKTVEIFDFNDYSSLPKTFKMSEHPQLSELVDSTIDGNWKLEIIDREGNGTGQLNSWGIKDQKCEKVYNLTL